MRYFIVLALVSSCAIDGEELSSTEQAAGCGKYLCGTNSPFAGALAFYELDMTGVEAAPDNGFRIISFRDSLGEAMEVDVLGFRLRGRKGNVFVKGMALEGSRLLIQNTTSTFEVTIESVTTSQRYYEDGNDNTKIPSYGMSIRPVGVPGQPRRLCAIPHDNKKMFQTGMYDALVYGGQRYDIETGDVYATGEKAGSWFNIACAGDSLSKALIARHAEPAADAGHPSTVFQRTAFIRMLRADYCGDATPHTELGTPLDWENTDGWNFLDEHITPLNIEAIWTHEGAVCLSNPRDPLLGALPCAPPPCTPVQIANWKPHGDLVSINP